jgi:DNA polymerase I-like protein with 3'-5' exonuclease and polymerase domains
MPQPLIAIDFETYYDAEYSLRKMSTWAYVNDPRFDAYLVALHGNGVHWVGDPKKCDWSAIKESVVVMHNASFDQMVLERLIEQGIVPKDCRPAQILCTADMTAYLGCKRDLASAAKFLLHKEISKQVRADMMGKHYQDAVAAGMEEDLLKYGGSDAELCFELAQKFLPKWPETEQKISCLNREAGMKGVAIDVRKVEEASRTLRLKLEELEQSLPWMDDPEAKPLSPKAIRAAGREAGIPVPASLAKDDPAVLDWVEKYGEQYPWVKALGQYRSLNILLKRVQSIESNLRADGTMPFQIKYAGAHTLRFSGGGDSGGKFNMQNMYKHEMFGVDLRSMLIPRPGHKFIIADFCQIEARVLLWRVGDTEFVDYINKVGNLYIAYAKKTMGKDVQKGTYEYALAKAQCLAPETLVLTRRGYIAIVDIAATDQVWDGLNWVAHEGLVQRGTVQRKDLVHYLGDSYTIDHRIFTGPTKGETEQAGIFFKRNNPGQLAWRPTPGSGWGDLWQLARAVGHATLHAGYALCRVSLHKVRAGVRSQRA